MLLGVWCFSIHSPPISTMRDITADVVIVDAGFSGCLSLHHMRIRGFSAKIIEAQGDFGGV